MPTPPSSRRTNRPTAARPRLRARIANRRTGGLWWRIPLVALLWLALVAPLLAAGAIIAVLRHHAADLPPVPDLDRWAAELPQTSIIVAADGTIAAELPFRVSDPQSESGDARPIDRVGHRFAVAFADLPQRLIEAVLAAEDIRFFEHPGVDIQAVVRAAWANYRAERIVEGASTLTQQVARNLLPVAIGRERSLRRKIREALLALRIEARYSKQRIFEVYVNQVFLGAGAYG
ncbi:MAG: transglycosylase domain-containing protein, partial [Myxococcota bacterium]